MLFSQKNNDESKKMMGQLQFLKNGTDKVSLFLVEATIS